MRPTLLILLSALGVGTAQLDLTVLGVDRLQDGNTLISTGNFGACDSGLVLEVDSFGRIVWASLGGGLDNVHTARRLRNGNTLISATEANRVIEVDRVGCEVWSIDGLSYPNEAYRLGNGNTLITDRDNNRVIEVDTGRAIVWSYDNLVWPHNGSRLGNGNTLICDSERDRVVEVDQAGVIVWRHAVGLSWPRSARRLDNGNTLIADSHNNRIVEVDTAGRQVWSVSTHPQTNYMAERLANGRTLISSPWLVYEVDSSGSVAWQWPGTLPIVVDSFFVRNPVTGLQLFVHVHRPTMTSAVPLPAVVLVPDGVCPGTYFDSIGLANLIAANGFAAMHFDADGRGRSDMWPEDYYGRINQEGLKASIEALARMPDIDTGRIGILTEGYGVTLASGMLAGQTNPLRVKFLVDFEGPADRYQSCVDSGGVVPVPPNDDSFWLEREAVRYMSRLPCHYLRVQTAEDHNPFIRDNRHCIALIDSATTGGLLDRGISPWTRVNDSVMNEPNRFYTLEDPPVWIPEAGEAFTPIRYLLYLQELIGLLEQTPVKGHTPVSSPAGSIAARPNPFRARTALDFGGQSKRAVQIIDMTGRLVRTLPPAERLVWDGRDELGHEVPSGVYYCRLRDSRTHVSAGLVKLQ
ncbi:MAG: hypothetical protein JSU73_07310 [candidate division WOR-3 bacterium]|nr:MAG: hypothetical protein JSU73_07310 [candidate division WOR-3 bacterium]